MPRYSFDSDDGGPALVEEDGLEADGVKAARREARIGLAD
jgi:hypothetical protein